MPDGPLTRKEHDERAESLEERRLTRAELLAAQAARTQLTLEAHERHFSTINGNIERFANQLAELQKAQVQRDAVSQSQLKGIAILLSVLMFLASAGSILATVFH